MKKIMMICVCLTICLGVNAQKTTPEIKSGSTLQAMAYVNGQEFPLVLTVKSIVAPVSIGWSVDGYGDGTFEMNAKSVESGTQFANASQPALGITKLDDTQTFSLISKDAYKSLSDTKAFTYGGVKFKLKTPDSGTFQINGKDANVFHVVSENGMTELWILNGAVLPLIVKSIGLSTDITINEIK